MLHVQVTQKILDFCGLHKGAPATVEIGRGETGANAEDVSDQGSRLMGSLTTL